MNRRDLLTMGSVGGASFPLLTSLALAAFRTSEPSPHALQEDVGPPDQNSLQFWSADVRTPEGPRERGISPSAPTRPAFFYYDRVSDTFRYGSEIGDEGLADKGTASIILRVDRIRPSATDQARIENIEGGSLSGSSCCEF